MAFQLRTVAEQIERMDSLDQPSEALGKALDPILNSRPLKDILSGTWVVGHPLHPILTDVVTGCWTSAWFLDLLGGEERRRAADTLIGLGCLSALPTAMSGAADWIDTGGKERRVGLVHAGANVAALTVYTLAYLARKRGKRVRGWSCPGWARASPPVRRTWGGIFRSARGSA
jgi:hypothetical protein